MENIKWIYRKVYLYILNYNNYILVYLSTLQVKELIFLWLSKQATP